MEQDMKPPFKYVRLFLLSWIALIFAACGNSLAREWDLVETSKIELGDNIDLYDLEISFDRERLGVLTSQGIHMYEFPGSTELWSRPEIVVTDSVLSQDGTLLAYAQGNNRIDILQVETGEQAELVTSGLENATSMRVMAFSPDNRLLAASVYLGPEERSVAMIWDIRTSQRVLTLQPEETLAAVEGMSWMFVTVEFSPDGSILASGLFGSHIILWEVATGTRIMDLQDLDNAFGTVDGLDWHPDGRLIASAHRGGTIAIWDTNTGELLHSFVTGDPLARELEWSPDGEYLAVGIYSAGQIWIVDSAANLLHTLDMQTESVMTIAWSSDGDYLVAGDSTGQVFVWEVPKQ
jgi:WD40 repeat protein